MFKQNDTDEAWIGVDLGTTGIRAIAYDKTGKFICTNEAFYPLLTTQPGWAEENPLQIYDCLEEVVRKTAADLRYKNHKLIGMALSTVMHSFIALDSWHKPLLNMQTWADSRSTDIVNELKKDGEKQRNFYEKTGCPTHPSYPFAKILWLKKHMPDIYNEMRAIGSIKDYIFEQLTGEWVIDHSTASSSGMYNMHEMDWDAEILDYVGIQRSQLPEIVSTTYKTTINPATAERLGVSRDLTIVIGATDGVLVNVGIGAVHKGQLSATIGTSGAIRMLTEKPQVDSKMRTWCYNLTDDMWVVGGAINNGGIILRWMRDKICHYSKNQLESLDVDGYDLMSMKASKIAPGSEGLIMLPCFTGERAPYWNSELRGVFFGLSINHSRSHMIRATMEGICYSLNSVFCALKEFGEIKDIRVSGSFTKSDLWVQILSDVLDHKLLLPKNSEGAAFGAVALGLLATGEINSIDEITSMVEIQKEICPDKSTLNTYKHLYRIFDDIYWKLQDDFVDIYKYQQSMY